MKLSKIEIITGMSKLTGLKSVLSRAGVRGMTVVQVLGCGVEKGTKEYEVDENYEMELLPKQQISIVVQTEKVKEIVELIKQELYTGHMGDGKIFVSDITNGKYKLIKWDKQERRYYPIEINLYEKGKIND